MVLITNSNFQAHAPPLFKQLNILKLPDISFLQICLYVYDFSIISCLKYWQVILSLFLRFKPIILETRCMPIQLFSSYVIMPNVLLALLEINYNGSRYN